MTGWIIFVICTHESADAIHLAGEIIATSPDSFSLRPSDKASESTLHTFISPSLLPVKIKFFSGLRSRDQTSARCARVVWTQCWVDKSQTFKKESLDAVTTKVDPEADDVEGTLAKISKNFMAVTWSRWPRSLWHASVN